MTTAMESTLALPPRGLSPPVPRRRPEAQGDRSDVHAQRLPQGGELQDMALHPADGCCCGQ
eukprot:1076735-Alexandrium_andersonii.AAC.1